MFKNRGFTLIEIMLVVALIGVLSTAVIVIVDPVTQFKRANDAKRKADLRQFQTALELYRSDIGAYPTRTPASPGYTCGTALQEGGVTYMQKMPCDPKNSGNYVFRYFIPVGGTNGQDYVLISCLENVRDPEKDQPNRVNNSGGTYCDGTTQWSYTLENP